MDIDLIHDFKKKQVILSVCKSIFYDKCGYKRLSNLICGNLIFSIKKLNKKYNIKTAKCRNNLRLKDFYSLSEDFLIF